MTGSARRGSCGSSEPRGEAVAPDHDTLPEAGLLRDAAGVALDLVLLEAAFDGGRRLARLLDSGQQLHDRALHVIGHPLDDMGGPVRVQRDGLVEAVGVRRLRAVPLLRRTTAQGFITGWWAVSCASPACGWMRRIIDFGFFAPNSSRMTRAQTRRAARNSATSSGIVS